jgi:Helix-turn-helix domain
MSDAAQGESVKRGRRLRVCWRQMARAVADPELSGADRSVLFVVMDHMDNDLVCFPGLGTIAKRAGVNRSTVVRSIGHLEKLKYIRRNSGNRVQANRYFLVMLDAASETESADNDGLGRCVGAPTDGAEGGCTDAPRCDSAPTETDGGRCASAPGGRCVDAPGVGAPTHPEPTQLTYPIEPAEKHTQAPLAALARVPDEPKPKSAGRRKRATEAEVAAGWVEFWAAYPRHVSAATAKKAWAKLSPDAALRAAILKALAAQKPAWAERDIRFTPHAATWLNAERWSDELDPPPAGTEWPLAPIGPGYLPRDTRSDEELLAEMEAAERRMRGEQMELAT